MGVKLFGIAHSHSVAAARLMLQHKRIEHQELNVLPGLHPIVVRAAGFEARTVPALRIDGRRVQGTLAISRALDEIEPDRPLFPADPERRAEVEDAEHFGHDELQALGRRLFRWAALRSQEVRAWMADEVVGLPAPRAVAWAYKPVIAYFARIVDADDATVREDLRRLPELLDRTDSMIDAGLIGGAARNAADYQILASVRLLYAQRDLLPILEGRRCAAAALEVLPAYPGPVPAALPVDWIPSPPRA